MKCGNIRFGPAGKPIGLGNKDILKAPEFLRNMGLDAMEYEAVRGVNISEDKARRLGELARKHDIVLSMHGPYYINLSSEEKAKIEASKKRILDSLKASQWMGSYIVVFHPGYYRKKEPKEASVKMVAEALIEVREKALSLGIKDVWIGPETTGRTSQVGTPEEIVEICRQVDKCRPAVDWAHLHARSMGSFPKSIDDIIKVIELFERELGRESIDPLHTHFSKIEYGKGGEKRHHTMAENYGPDFEMVCRAYGETGVNAVIISESPILEKDSLLMKSICERLCA